MIEFLRISALLLVLLNPFLVIVYLIDILEKLDRKQFTGVVLRAGLISSVVFCGFAVVGDAVFHTVMHAEFASFQIFGGIVFLLIGLQFVFRGPRAIQILRGDSQHLAGAVAMPVLIGPGTISASIIVGQSLDPLPACVSVVVTVALCVLTMVILKALHDFVRPRREPLIERYVEIAGRITSLFVGTISVEMIMQGIRTWSQKF